jgi:hypothetical protein
VTKRSKAVIVCPVQDWSIFFAIGIYRKLKLQYDSVCIMPRSIAQENVLMSDLEIKIHDESSVDGSVYFLAPDPIAERDARRKGLEVHGCVIDEQDSRWSLVSECWNGHSDDSIFSAYEAIYGEDMDMSVLEKIKSLKPYAGVAIKNDHVRMLVKSAFFLDNSRLWHVPVRQNTIKRIQESCSCATLITDDPFCAMSSVVHGNSAVLLRGNCDGLPNLSWGSRLIEQGIPEASN